MVVAYYKYTMSLHINPFHYACVLLSLGYFTPYTMYIELFHASGLVLPRCFVVPLGVLENPCRLYVVTKA